MMWCMCGYTPRARVWLARWGISQPSLLEGVLVCSFIIYKMYAYTYTMAASSNILDHSAIGAAPGICYNNDVVHMWV